jgi:competence protein ComGF
MKKSQFIIGEKYKLSSFEVNDFKSKGLDFYFENDKLLGVTLNKHLFYETSKKINIHSMFSEVKKKYGKPKGSKFIIYGANKTILYQWNGLIYENIAFESDTNGIFVLNISIDNLIKNQ